jgi:hypothetical protein
MGPKSIVWPRPGTFFGVPRVAGGAERDAMRLTHLKLRAMTGRPAFPAVNHLKRRSCLIDGDMVCWDKRGVAAFKFRNGPCAIKIALARRKRSGRCVSL